MGISRSRRVTLEQDLKREYQEFLQDHNRDRFDSDERSDRSEDEIPRLGARRTTFAWPANRSSRRR